MTILARRAGVRRDPHAPSGQDLNAWIDAVLADDLPALHRLVHGLREDHEAVPAGLTPPHSDGPTEGLVNKIKLLERQTCGRASFALLRK